MVYRRNSPSLDATFGALAAPARREILFRLERETPTIADLASHFSMSLPAVSKHVRVLERAGLATVYRDGRARRVRLRAEPLREAAQMLERYRAFWTRQLDELASYLAEHPSTHDDSTGRDSWHQTNRARRSANSRSKSGG